MLDNQLVLQQTTCELCKKLIWILISSSTQLMSDHFQIGHGIGLDQSIWLVVNRVLSASWRIRVVASHLVEIIKRNDHKLIGQR